MIKQKLRSLPAHIQVAKEVSKSRNGRLWLTMLKMVIAKMYHEISISDYAINDLETIPYKNWRYFINKKDLTDIQKKLNPIEARSLIDNKIYFYLRCIQLRLLTPTIWAVIGGNHDDLMKLPQSTIFIRDRGGLAEFFENNAAPKDIIIKSANGAYSEGFISVKIKDGRMFNTPDKPYADMETYQHLFDGNQNEAYLVQERLKPHDGIKPLMPGNALGCIRVVTYYSEPEPMVLFVFIKIPVGDNQTDAFQHGFTGNLIANVDLKTGVLGKAWGKRPGQDVHCLTEFLAHPTSGIPFQGFSIPQWNDVLSLAIQGAKAFSELKLIGWDVALCENGVFLMEGNNLWDPDGPQITLRKGIKKEMLALLQ